MRMTAIAIATVTGLLFMATAPLAYAKKTDGHFKGGHHKVLKKQGGVALPLIRRKLKLSGYKQIIYTDRKLPIYKVRACRNGKQYSLRLNGRGKVLSRARLGKCRV